MREFRGASQAQMFTFVHLADAPIRHLTWEQTKREALWLPSDRLHLIGKHCSYFWIFQLWELLLHRFNFLLAE
jgi:hypothetical protein